MNRYPEGSVHGRFQPFHNGHLRYLLAAAERCDFLWVGITQPEVGALRTSEEQPTHRYQPVDNPLTYDQRAEIIRSVIADSSVDLERTRVVPFPIETPEHLQDHVPKSAVAFTTIYDEWNRRKVGILEDCGYIVEVLWESDAKEVSGGQVRQLIRAGDPAWEEMMPKGAVISLVRTGGLEIIRTTGE